MDSTKPVYIYALVDPRTDEVRYVGKTVNPKSRLQAHRVPSSIRKGTYCARWVGSLRQRGLSPLLTVLEITTDDGFREAERRWIDHYRRAGAKLANATRGGEGQARMGLAQREALRIANCGAQNARSHLTDDQVMDIRHRYASGEYKHVLAREYDLSPSAILAIVKGKVWTHLPVLMHQAPSRLPQTKLTEDQVAEILVRYGNRESQESLAVEFGVARSTIQAITSGTNWNFQPRSGYSRRRPNHVLTPDDVRDIRKRYADGESQASIAAFYRAASSGISNIVNRRTRADIE